MGPGAPSGGVRVADVVRQILDARTRSAHHSFQEFEHFPFIFIFGLIVL